jgi:hypothetical protein
LNIWLLLEVPQAVVGVAVAEQVDLEADLQMLLLLDILL